MSYNGGLIQPPDFRSGEVHGVCGRWPAGEAMFATDHLCDVISSFLIDDSKHGTVVNWSSYHPNDAYELSYNAPVAYPNVVAAGDEVNYIENTLNAYTALTDTDHRIFLFCNWQPGADTSIVKRTIDIIDDFQRNHDDIPLAYAVQEVPIGTTIGQVRRIADLSRYLSSRYSAESSRR